MDPHLSTMINTKKIPVTIMIIIANLNHMFLGLVWEAPNTFQRS